MNIWRDPIFERGVLGIASSYGPVDFWLQNLFHGMNPDATWRALLVMAAFKNAQIAPHVRPLLNSPDSRVRAWACYALGRMSDEGALDEIENLSSDPSIRVRYHARYAMWSLRGPAGLIRARRIMRSHAEYQILISDDSPKTREQLTFLLRQKGFRSITANSEQETLEKALEFRPAVILTDNQKKRDNLSGLIMTWDLCRNPELRETILVMISADEVEAPFLWNGGDRFIHKGSYPPDIIGSLISEYLMGV